MNAAAIIDEIKHLPRSEQDQVVEFVQTLEKGRPWSGEKLTEYSKRMVETNDPAEAERLKQQIIAGFYGDDPLAEELAAAAKQLSPHTPLLAYAAAQRLQQALETGEPLDA